MMVTGPNVNAMEINQYDLSDEKYSDEEESYSDEIIDEFSIEMHPGEPQTFEDFNEMYRAEPRGSLNENDTSEEIQPTKEVQSTLKPNLISPNETSQESPIPFSQEPEDVDYYPDSDEEIEEEIEEEQEISGKKLLEL